MRQLLALLGLTVWLVTPALAEQNSYLLNTEDSVVGFTYKFHGNDRYGRMPVARAMVVLDLDNMSDSQVDVTLNAADATAGARFMTSTIKGVKILNTKAHPEIIFHSTRIVGSMRKAKITGDLTIRGITHPVTLDAGLYRQQGTAPTDRSKLVMQMLGSISRSAFGAGGFSGFVDDEIDLKIIAYIER